MRASSKKRMPKVGCARVVTETGVNGPGHGGKPGLAWLQEAQGSHEVLHQQKSMGADVKPHWRFLLRFPTRDDFWSAGGYRSSSARSRSPSRARAIKSRDRCHH